MKIVVGLGAKRRLGLLVVFQCWLTVNQTFRSNAFSMPTPSSSSPIKEIYNVPGSGWKSPNWNWGYGVGTGHDCAAICRQKYARMEDREELVRQLISSPTAGENEQRLPANFEEVKLVMALAWQQGRWDGSDGGEGGYGEVLQAMADARRYEGEDETTNCFFLFKDMKERYHLLDPSPEDMKEMQKAEKICETDADAAVRCCSGLVLKSMGFVNNG
mmetsp:Transcript_7719/g.19133  ORF Transcript_7719/g.19133 Transcript_7719/m.19133 type:complete len:216 (+) Transcript_7719:144-791(+)